MVGDETYLHAAIKLFGTRHTFSQNILHVLDLGYVSVLCILQCHNSSVHRSFFLFFDKFLIRQYIILNFKGEHDSIASIASI